MKTVAGVRGEKVALLDEKCMSIVLGAAGRKLAGCKTSSTRLDLNPQRSAFLGPEDRPPPPLPLPAPDVKTGLGLKLMSKSAGSRLSLSEKLGSSC